MGNIPGFIMSLPLLGGNDFEQNCLTVALKTGEKSPLCLVDVEKGKESVDMGILELKTYWCRGARFQCTST